ncbi:SGNH/GDSL hydrolase family protein [Knoellia subterranea]|uniref:SGNH hydrolase-type esterase domain-containing protein n=1 Tax=Knoellia subterranea KCTC 19937 TaxID=1385521 RepID=A0A0A0JQ56_9MICO|nr:SGNH/GDSL hydrolase family protein [Knoellia subterranea]KGN38869.1 hypothetical protein N803_07950 [Knoellia subterranea KCTC 19937]
MNDRQRNGALAGLLVLVLLIAGFLLRSRDDDDPAAAGPSPSPSSASSSSPSPTATAVGGPVVFLGDSMTEGKDATGPARRWTALVAAELGGTEVNLAHAGTGYVRAGAEGSCGASACANYQGQVAEAVKAAPAVVFVTGGGNDASTSPTDFAKAATDLVAALTTALPRAKVYVVNPWWDLRPVPGTLAAQTTAVQTAATAGKATFLDTGQPLVGKPQLMVANGANPNDAGHAALAQAVQKALGTVGAVGADSGGASANG